MHFLPSFDYFTFTGILSESEFPMFSCLRQISFYLLINLFPGDIIPLEPVIGFLIDFLIVLFAIETKILNIDTFDEG